MNINLKDVREYYGKMTALLNFMNLIFVLVIAGLGIYIADIMNESGEGEKKIFALYTVFVVGIILVILLFISSFMGRKGEYEGAIRIRRVLSVLSFIVGAISLYISIDTVVSTYKKWEDGYTAAIFIIQLVVSFLVEAASILTFIFAYNGNKYFDSKKLAKDIPEKMTAEKNTRKYMALIGLSYYIFSLSVFLMSYYFASEIDYFSKYDLSDNSIYSGIYNVIFVIGTITGIIVLLTALCMVIIKSDKMYVAGRISYGTNTAVQLFFVIYSLINISKDFVKSSHPDIAYIIFSLVLVAIDVLLAIKSEKAVRNLNRSHR